MTEQESEWAAEMIAQAKRDHETILALREMLAQARRERDAWVGADERARAECGVEIEKVQAELKRVRTERDGLMCAPLWHPPLVADDRQHLIDLYGCAGEEALFDLLVKTECERLRREGLMREFEDLLILDAHTPEQRERLRVLDATLVLGVIPWPVDSIAMIKAQRFIEQVTATLGKKTRHGEGE